MPVENISTYCRWLPVWAACTLELALGGNDLPVPQTEILTFGSQKVLCVERFDRMLGKSGALLRLPQEDFCQALGVSPHREYEADGGPGICDIAAILRQSEHAEDDIAHFLRAQILYWMLAAPDGHAKNFSLWLLPGGRFRMTPLYDVMSIWPVEGDGANRWSWHKASLAMAVRGASKHYRMRDVKRSHFNETARLCRYGRNAEALIADILERTEPVIDSVASALPPRFPEKVASRIFKGLREAAQRLHAVKAERIA